MLQEYGSSDEELRKRPARSQRGKRSKKLKNVPQDFSFDYNGPWGASSESEEEEQDEIEEPAVPEIPPVEPELAEITESYTDEDFTAFKDTPKQEAPCQAPQSIARTIEGHSKGITKLLYFPRTGHLLLSAGNDGKIFIWDSATMQKLRGYFGHTNSIKDVVFDKKGTKFLSCSFDKTVLLWKTLTGEVTHKLTCDSVPNCVMFNPNNENEILVGLSSNKIHHYDLSAPEWQLPVQIYDHHLGPVNSLTAVDKNLKFLSTSDDRTVRIWAWKVNIPLKIISDPSQHSMPRVAVNTADQHIALQTMDNTIQMVQSVGKFKYTRKSYFKGHKNAGFGIGLLLSHDFTILSSGDSTGQVFFWDWKTRKIVRRMKLSESVISCIASHPCHSTQYVAGGKSGDIYELS